MSQNYSIIIIGGGVAGLFTAYYLSKAGAEVTVIEKTSGTDNCSYGNAGMIVPSHIIPLASPGIISMGLKWMLDPESPFYIRPRMSLNLLKWGWEFKKASSKRHVQQSGPVLRDLLLQSRELLIDLEQNEKIDFGYVKKGLFMFCNTEHGLKKEIEIAEKAMALGLPAEVLTAGQVKEMEPDIQLDIIGATYYPQDAHLHPGSLMDNLKTVLAKSGVKIVYNTEITGLTSKNGVIQSITDSKGESWEGSRFVICTGAWSSSMARIFKTRLLMQAGKGYSITLDSPSKKPKYCGILSEKKVTMTPMNNKLRFAGTMEIVGTDRSINSRKIAGLKKSVSEYLPDFQSGELDGHTIWTGLRPCSPDGLPYVGSMGEFSNLYTSTGQSMMGMSLAPSCGKMISDIITDGKSELNNPLIDPRRFN